MSPSKAWYSLKSLADSPFSKDRLVIWTLGISVILSLTFIFILGYQGKEIPPSLTMAAGFIIKGFTEKFEKNVENK